MYRNNFLTESIYIRQRQNQTCTIMHSERGPLYCGSRTWASGTFYWVSQKKLLSKSEEKMHQKMKMTSQGAENLVHVQQHQGKTFYKKIFFFFLFIQLIWLFECLQNLFKYSSLCVISITKKSLFQVVWIMLKMSKDNFFWDTQYKLQTKYYLWANFEDIW